MSRKKDLDSWELDGGDGEKTHRDLIPFHICYNDSAVSIPIMTATEAIDTRSGHTVRILSNSDSALAYAVDDEIYSTLMKDAYSRAGKDGTVSAEILSYGDKTVAVIKRGVYIHSMIRILPYSDYAVEFEFIRSSITLAEKTDYGL